MTEGPASRPAPGRGPRSYLDWSDEGRPAVWRYLLAVVLGFVCWTFGNVPAIVLLGDVLRDPATRDAALQFTFLIGLAAIPLLVRLLLGRPGYSVALPAWPPRWRDWGLGLVLGWAAMSATFLAFSPFIGITYRGWGGTLAPGVPVLAAGLAGFAIQTAFEEVYFRGLVAQATRRLVKWTPVVLLVPALFFAQLHIGNIAAFGTGSAAMLPYLVDGLLLGWAAWRSGSLLLPMGLHFANNTFIMLFVSSGGDVVNFTTPFVAPTPTLSRSILFAVVRAALVVGALELHRHRRDAVATG